MKKNKFHNNIATKITLVVLSVFLVISLAFVGAIIYHDNYYSTFWVNGQSMYPTLNHDAKYDNGELVGQDDMHMDITKYTGLDYGIMDTHQKTLDNLKRFDIVICYYGENDDDYKIKRLCVLPGETFYISSSDTNPGDNGNLYILNTESNEFELVEQPIDKEYVHNGVYTATYADKNNPVTLASDEVFVMGDNRIGNHSNDSRKVGPIKHSQISGKAVAIEGTCQIRRDIKNGEVVLKPTHIKRHKPRYL